MDWRVNRTVLNLEKMEEDTENAYHKLKIKLVFQNLPRKQMLKNLEDGSKVEQI